MHSTGDVEFQAEKAAAAAAVDKKEERKKAVERIKEHKQRQIAKQVLSFDLGYLG